LKQNTYGFSIRLPEQITDVVPEYHSVPDPVGMHCHDCYEIEVVVSGSGTQILNGQPCALERGCVTLLAPTDFHAVTPEKDLSLYNFMFRGSILSPRLLRVIWDYESNKLLRIEGDALQEVISVCELLVVEHRKQSPNRAIFMKNLIECFFLLLLRALPDNQSQREYTDSITRGIAFMHQNFRENPSLRKTASLVGLNPDYFSHRFRQVTGTGYNAYLTRLKLNHAKKLLLSNSATVTEICFSSGFTSVSNFMRVFKDHTGMSPKQYTLTHTRSKE
jgi:AraC-like DNA-binding protein